MFRPLGLKAGAAPGRTLRGQTAGAVYQPCGANGPARSCRRAFRNGMLITNDTGTMHLAAGLNLPILAIFLATAQPWDTGPYQEKHVLP